MSSRNGGAGRDGSSASRHQDSSIPRRAAGQSVAQHAHLKANLAIWEDRLRKLPEGVSELHVLAAKNGDHLFSRRVGTGSTTQLSADQVQQMHDAILSRNHHSGMPPSTDEAGAAFRAGARELRAVTPEGRYWLRATSPVQHPWSAPAYERVRSAYSRAHDALVEQQTANVRAGRVSAEQAESPAGRRALAEGAWRAVAADPANHLSFGFTRWPTDEGYRRAQAAAFARDVLATLDKREQAISRREQQGAQSGGGTGTRRSSGEVSPQQSGLDRYVYEALRQMEEQQTPSQRGHGGARTPGAGRKRGK